MAAATATKAPPAPDFARFDPTAFGAAIAKAFTAEGGSLLLLDLDGLHPINEEAGHDVGDKVIRAAAAVLKRWSVDERWTSGRVGGDEFALYAPGLTLEAAFLKADRLRQEVDAAVAKQLTRSHRCTASIGVANAPRDAKTASDLHRKAELALHAAKEQGGDTVALTPGAEMVLKSSYYTTAQLGRLKSLAERQKKKEAVLLREALDELIRKYDRAS